MSALKYTSSKNGFTIVELLIVIVVIGILAAIIMVTYNGLRTRANTATVKSDLANAAKTMAADHAVNNAYALNMNAVNGGKGLSASKGTVYQFTSTSNTYCITGTNNTISYMVTHIHSTPQPGGCSGHAANGDILNLATNPSFETNMASWGSTWVATPVNRVVSGSGIVSGTAALEINLSTANASGGQYNFSNLQANTPHTAAVYVTLISGDPTSLALRVGDGAGTRASKTISTSVIVGQPVRTFLTWTSSGSPNGAMQIWRNGPSPEVAVIRVDNLMITTGSDTYSYADGNSPNWVWNGTPNNSTSMGSL